MENQENDVYILDSYGLIFRCYFAFINRPLLNSSGQNISALFGFFRNIKSVLEHYKPKYFFAAMDSKTKTFRHEKFPEYKATRNKTPDDLHAQIPWIQEILDEIGIPVLQCDGYEADDVIATVVKKCHESGRNCKILTGDKDLMQLVDENTKILKPDSAGFWKLTDAEGVKAEWGVPPEQLKDLLSLYGDSADNIPGVKGIGVKTAGKLLSDYKSLDGIYENIEKITGATQKKLLDGKENAFKSRDLIELCESVPCAKIDEVLSQPDFNFKYAKASELLKKYGVFQVAKSFAEEALKNGEKLNSDFTEEPEKSAVKSSVSENNFSSENFNKFFNKRELFSSAVKNSASYKAVLTLPELKSVIDSALEKKFVAFDCETDSLDTQNAKIAGFSLSFQKGEGFYIPITAGTSLFDSEGLLKNEAFSQLKRLFDSTEQTVIFHNGKFDLKILANNGLFGPDFTSLSLPFSNKSFSSIIKCQIVDTMVGFWLENPERSGKSFGLEYLAETVLGLKGTEFDEIVSKGKSFFDVELSVAKDYAAEDADFTFQLFEKLRDCKDSVLTSDLFKMEMKILPILAEMELNGIHLDSKVLNDFNKELTKNISNLEQKIYSEVGHDFNISSPKQLQTVLFEERKLPTGKKTKTGFSTDTSVLEELALLDSVPKMILEFREMTKLKSTYVETLPLLADKNERIHTDFVQTGTATGRLSCREPNLQNIPVRSEDGRKIRTAFTAPKNKVLISADYSQIELVVLSHLTKDKNMSDAFINGIDVHKSTASLIYNVPMESVTPEMRRTAKTINFGVIYGMSAFRLAQDLNISRTQAKEFIESYFEKYSSIKDFISSSVKNAEQNGFVETIFARKRPILNINSKNKLEKAQAERIAVNTQVQGSAADIVKKAMLDVSDALKQKNNGTKLLLQVHDELIFECSDEQNIIEETVSLIREKMENAVKLSVPLKVSIEYGKNWGAFH